MFYKKALFLIAICTIFALGACGGETTEQEQKNEETLLTDTLNKLEELNYCSTTEDCTVTPEVRCRPVLVNKNEMKNAEEIINKFHDELDQLRDQNGLYSPCPLSYSCFKYQCIENKCKIFGEVPVRSETEQNTICF